MPTVGSPTTLAFALILPTLIGCGGLADPVDEVSDEAADIETGETGGTGETTGSETSGEETSGEETSGEETSGDGDSEPKPCTWSDFPSQYGIADSLGQNCGALTNSPTSAQLDTVFACLQAAYDADEPAYATADWIDYDDQERGLAWYVRPPEDTSPRRIETQFFKPYSEAEPPPPGTLSVYRCTAFVNCYKVPSAGCKSCQQEIPLSCVEH